MCNSILTLFFTFLGDVHVGMVDRGGQLEVEVNQARRLTPKPGSKNIPGTDSPVQSVLVCWEHDLLVYLHVFFSSHLCEGICLGKWSVLGQEENQSSEEESGPHLPAGFVV